MSRETRSIPGLFGGVSQQIPAMRHPTQGEHQHNMLATVVDGLFLRPGSVCAPQALTSPGASADRAFGHFFTTPDGALYVLTLVNGGIQLHDANTGAPQTVTTPDGVVYLSTLDPENGFACLTLADYTFIVNRSQIPAMTAAVSASNPTNVAYVEVRTAVANQSYTIKVDAVTESYASGVTPAQSDISGNLAGQLSTTLGAGYTVTLLADAPNVVKIVKSAGVPAVVATDSWDNKTMMVLSDGVPTYADLPPRFETGFTVAINGTADEATDPYFVKWDGTKWVETTRPGTKTTLNKGTLPHQLVQASPGNWVFQAIPDWGQRLVGDDDTNPEPSFIGAPIRDVFFFRNRLGFLSLDNTILSRAGEYFDFFARSSTQVLDSDPIDLAPPVGGIGYLSHAQEFNEELLIWTDANKQLRLVGGDALSPKNARLVPATTFAMDPATRPASLGNRAVFADTTGSHAALSVYKVARDAATNTADPISGHVPRYIKASPRQLVASTSARLVAVLANAPGGDVALFRYELDRQSEEYSQTAWSSMKLAGTGTPRIIAGTFDKHRLVLLVHRFGPSDPNANGRFFIEAIDFRNDAVDASLDHSLCLDRRMVLTTAYASGNTTATFPYVDPAAVFYLCEPGRAPIKVTPTAAITTGGLATQATFAGNLTAYTLIVGVPYEGTYTFTEVVFRDNNGVPVQAASIKLLAYLVRLESSSDVVFSITPKLRDTKTYTASAWDLCDAPVALGGLLLASGTARVPVQAQASGTKVSLTASGPLRATVPYAEWIGEVTMSANR